MLTWHSFPHIWTSQQCGSSKGRKLHSVVLCACESSWCQHLHCVTRLTGYAVPMDRLVRWTSSSGGCSRAEGSVAPINPPGLPHGESQGIRHPCSMVECFVASSDPPGISMNSHNAVGIIMLDGAMEQIIPEWPL